MDQIRSTLHRLFGRRPGAPADPAHPVDVGLPLGAFKLCDRQLHVMESWARVCQGCQEADQGPAAFAPAPPSRSPGAAPMAPPLPVGVASTDGPKPTNLMPAMPFDELDGRDPAIEAAFPLSEVFHALPGIRQSVSIPAAAEARPRRTEFLAIPPAAGADERRRAVWGRLVLEIDLRGDACRLGASPDLEVPLLAPDLAPHHATLRLSQGQVQLELTGAGRAAVQVNGRGARSGQVLRHGDKIHLGALRLRLERLDGEQERG